MAGTLIFPSSVPAATEYARAAARRGERVVGASSLTADENAAAFPVWERLPSVHDAGFAAALTALVERHGLTHAFAPVTSTHAALAALKAAGRCPLILVDEGPIAEQNAAAHRDLDRAADLRRFMAAIVDGEPQADRLPSQLRVAAVLRQARLTYGESSDVKLAALLAVAALAPAGDVVEIGTLTGKSAVVLAAAAHLFGAGPVLTVDPWSLDTAVQVDSPQLVQDMTSLWEADMLRASYYLNMIPLAGGRLNHLQATSEEAFALYARDGRVETPEMGATTYAGRIALLHVDGNHDLSAVRRDWQAWGSRMLPGGWVVFDDYTWLHGRGPRIVGDAVLDGSALPGPPWDRAFVCGGALFLRLAASS